MKKYLYHISLTILMLLIALSVVRWFYNRAETYATKEIKALSAEIQEAYDILYQRKTLQGEALASTDDDIAKLQETGKKVHELDLQIQKKIENIHASIQATSTHLARLSILPQFSELLYLTGNTLEAQNCIDAGVDALTDLPDVEIRASLYITYAKSGLRCRDFSVYERCLTEAETLVENAQDAKWKSEKENTLADLKQLAEECQYMPEQVFLPVLRETDEGGSIPEEELPQEVMNSRAGASNQVLPEDPSGEIELDMMASEPLSLEYLDVISPSTTMESSENNATATP